MSKKSASSVRVKAPKQAIDTKEQFDKFIGVEKLKMEAALIQSKRIDTWVSMYRDMMSFGLFDGNISKSEQIELVNKMFDEEIKLYNKMVKDLDEFTYEDLVAEDYVDPYAHHIIAPKDCKDMFDYFHAFLIWSTVRSWAEHLLDLRRAVLDELAKDGEE